MTVQESRKSFVVVVVVVVVVAAVVVVVVVFSPNLKLAINFVLVMKGKST